MVFGIMIFLRFRFFGVLASSKYWFFQDYDLFEMLFFFLWFWPFRIFANSKFWFLGIMAFLKSCFFGILAFRILSNSKFWFLGLWLFLNLAFRNFGLFEPWLSGFWLIWNFNFLRIWHFWNFACSTFPIFQDFGVRVFDRYPFILLFFNRLSMQYVFINLCLENCHFNIFSLDIILLNCLQM